MSQLPTTLADAVRFMLDTLEASGHAAGYLTNARAAISYLPGTKKAHATARRLLAQACELDVVKERIDNLPKV